MLLVGSPVSTEMIDDAAKVSTVLIVFSSLSLFHRALEKAPSLVYFTRHTPILQQFLRAIYSASISD